jgi:hypothetical protein
MSKKQLIESFNELRSKSERDFRCIKIGSKYVECIEYIAFEPNSPFMRKFDLELIENEINQIDIIDEMNELKFSN